MILNRTEFNGAASRKMPKAVMYQCEWILRDEGRLRELAAHAESEKSEGIILYADDKSGLIPESVVEEAVRKIRAIDIAASVIPDEYRKGILRNIIYGERYPDEACMNTWKKWKKIFLETLAHELDLY